MAQAMDKLYETFSPPERLRLFLEAMARGDEAEATRLWGSCRRRTYRQADAAFVDRHQVAFDTAAVAAGDLHHLCGRVRALRWGRELIEALTAHEGIIADMALVEGMALAEGRPQSPFFRPDRRRQAAPEESAHPSPAQGEGRRRRSAAYSHEELAERSLAVERRAREPGERVAALLAEAERAAAGALALAWTALGRFCRERCGVEPAVLMGAWRLGVHEEVKELLALCPHDEPDEVGVGEYHRLLRELWDVKIGGGEGGDGHGR